MQTAFDVPKTFFISKMMLKEVLKTFPTLFRLSRTKSRLNYILSSFATFCAALDWKIKATAAHSSSWINGKELSFLKRSFNEERPKMLIRPKRYLGPGFAGVRGRQTRPFC